MARAIHARFVVTSDGPPIRDGAVVEDADRRIVDVGSAGAVLPRHAGAEIVRVEGVVFPGLVNAHTHLELSALAGKVPAGLGFVGWVDRLMRARAEVTDREATRAAEAAVRELRALGTAAVGEVTNTGMADGALTRADMHAYVFHEVFGLRRTADSGRRTADGGQRTADSGQRTADSGRRTADSGRRTHAPAAHALHTTHPHVVRHVMTHVRAAGLRTSIHLGEHPGERLAIEEGAGPMADWLAARSGLPAGEIRWPCRPLFDVAEDRGLLGPHALLVHLTCARPDEIGRVVGSGARVVLCPRSNRWIEDATPPLEALLAAGVVPALGTDSLASNASLDVLAEAATLARHFPDTPADVLLAMATGAGADALGFAHLGRIRRGARPGLVAVEGEIRADPARFLLDHADLPRAWVSAP